MKDYDLRLRKIKCEAVLEVIVERGPNEELCKWRDRHQLLQAWLEGRLANGTFSQVILEIPRILKESHTLSNLDKQYIADWIIDALLPHRLHTRGERVLRETTRALLFDVLLPGKPSKQDSESYHDEQLLYAIRRWFALASDPHRVWFKEIEYSREQEMRKALFDKNGRGQMYPFYSRHGFPDLARDIAQWFLIHYDLVTSARIHCELYRMEGKRRFTQVLYGRAWWIWLLAACVVIMTVGVLLPLLGTDVIGAPTASALIMYGVLAFVLLHLVLAPPDLRLLKMLGAIGVGYVVLLITGDVWKFAFLIWHGPSTFHALSISTVSLMASFLYVLAEMHDSVYSWCKRVKRTSLILAIGLGQSLVVGIGACLLAGNVFSEKVIKMQETIPDYAKFQLHFQWGSTDFALYPEMVIFFAPVALFVGLFAQILWEEKEITSPL